jgi:hypothetical protein
MYPNNFTSFKLVLSFRFSNVLFSILSPVSPFFLILYPHARQHMHFPDQIVFFFGPNFEADEMP